LLIALQTKRKEAGALCKACRASMILSADDGGLFSSQQEQKEEEKEKEKRKKA